MSNLICKENFNWQKYVNRYKDLKNIADLDTAWNHWCEEGRKQGRKFFTLTPYKNNKFYIITKEYIKQKNIKLKKNKSNIVVSSLDDDAVIEDFISNIKHKIKRLDKNKTFFCQPINTKPEINHNKPDINTKPEINHNKSDINIKPEINHNKPDINTKPEINHNKPIKNDDIEILEKDVMYTECKKFIKVKDDWTYKTENSEIFFIDYDTNNDSSESKIYLSNKNPLNKFSDSI
jgi:hypothetical protein